MPYCTQCGTKAPDDASFCPVCGAKLISGECDAIAGTASVVEAATRFRFAGPTESGRDSSAHGDDEGLISEAQKNMQRGRSYFERDHDLDTAATKYRTALEKLFDALLRAYGFEDKHVLDYREVVSGMRPPCKSVDKESFLRRTKLLSKEEGDQAYFVRERGNAGTHGDNERPLTSSDVEKAGAYIEELLQAFQDKINQALGDPALVKQKQIEVFNRCCENAKHAGKDDVEREYEERLNKCKLGYFGAAACSSPASQLVQGEASFAGGSAVGEAKIDQLINSFEDAVDELAESQHQLDSKRAYVAGFSKNQMASQWREVEAANKEIKWLYERKCALSEQVSDYIRSINSELNRISGRYGRAAVTDLVERANAVAVRAGYGKRTFTASKYYEGGGMKDENLKYGCMSFAIFFFVIFFVMPFLFGWAMRG